MFRPELCLADLGSQRGGTWQRRHQALLDRIVAHYKYDDRIRAIVVFGSVSTGEWHELSDLDLDDEALPSPQCLASAPQPTDRAATASLSLSAAIASCSGGEPMMRNGAAMAAS